MISGFTLEPTINDTWVAFGDNGKKANIIHINKHTHLWRREHIAAFYTSTVS